MYPEQTEAMKIEANAEEEHAIIERVDRQLVTTSELPQPEEKKNKRKRLMADAENIPARITRSKVVNLANNTRSKKKIWIWTVNLNLYDEFELLSMFVLNSRACDAPKSVCWILHVILQVFYGHAPIFLTLLSFALNMGSTKLVNRSGLARSWFKGWLIYPNFGTHVYLGLIHHVMLENFEKET